MDALWVRGLGVEATAAVTTSIFVMWAIYALNDIFAIGVTAYTSQLLGAGERRRAGVAAYKGLRASALLGLIGTVLGVFFARQVYGLMGSDPHLLATGSAYLAIVLGGVPLAMMALTCESIMRASGDTRTPLIIDLCAVGFNAALDPLLIYGWGPIHGMGVAGAAWATVAAWAMWIGGYLVVAARGHRALPLARRADGPPVRIAGMVRVGTSRSRARPRALAPPRSPPSASPTASRRSSSPPRSPSAPRARRWWARISARTGPTARSRSSKPD